jgi:hypothetical protein
MMPEQDRKKKLVECSPRQEQKEALLHAKLTVYEEKAPYSNTIKMIIVSGLFLLAFLYFIAVFGKAPEQAQFALLSAVSIVALVMWSFFNMKFWITTDGVEAEMPPFKYRVSFSNIEEVRTIDNIPWYVGWGLRLWGRGLAFVSMHKSSVEIKMKNGFFRRLVLTTKNPEEFVKKVREKLE